MDSLQRRDRTDRISVCMATYNGSAYVNEQLASILSQIGPNDEVIVADDASTDDTAAVVTALGDPRVTLLRTTQNQGHVRTFERAICAATSDYIFLADQDDVWTEGRVRTMLDALCRRPVVAGNVLLFGDRTGPPRGRLRVTESGAGLRNLARILTGSRRYLGSAMAFRRELMDVLVPIPGYVESHDVWLAMVGNLVGGVEHLEEVVLRRRLHGSNLTLPRRRSLGKLLVSRVLMLRAVLEVLRRRSRALRG